MKAILQNSEEQEKETSAPVETEELPVREVDEFQDVPVPRRVTRETDAQQGDDLSEKEDLRHGDEGVDDPPPQSDQMGD